ncbi:hypothetical protein ACFE04_007826 [Oxalis oulophora]
MDFNKARRVPLYTTPTTTTRVNPSTELFQVNNNTQRNPSFSSIGSFAIRAPLTLDDDDDTSDFESNGHDIVIGSGSDDSSVVNDFVSESDEGFVSGQELDETPNKEILRLGVVSRPSAVNLNENDFSDVSVGEETESSDIELDMVVRPIAQLSMEDDEFREMLTDEDMTSEGEYNDFWRMAKVPSVRVFDGSDNNSELDENLDMNYNSDGKDKGVIGVRDIHVESIDREEEDDSLVQDFRVEDDVKNGTDFLTEELGRFDESGNSVFGECSDTEKLEMLERNTRPELFDAMVPDKAEYTDLYMEGCEETMHLKELHQADCDSGERFGGKSKFDVVLGKNKERDTIHVESIERVDSNSMKSLDEDVKNVVEVTVEAGNGTNFESDHFDVSGIAAFGQGCEERELEMLESNLRAEFSDMLSTDKADYLDIVMESSEETMHSGEVQQGSENKSNHDSGGWSVGKSLLSDEDVEGIIFGSSSTAQQFVNELEQTLVSSSLLEEDDSAAYSQDTVGAVEMDSDEEMEKSRDVNSFRVAAKKFGEFQDVSKESMSEDEKKKMQKFRDIQVKFLRLVYRLGHSPDDTMVAQVLENLGTLSNQVIGFESANTAAMELEGGSGDDLDLTLNVLVLGKAGVGKSATINSIFGNGQEKINAFEHTTCRVKDIVGVLNGVRVRILDTPSLKSQQGATNYKTFASIRKTMKKFPPNVILYVDRLDTHASNLEDLPLLKALTNFFGVSIWKNVVTVLTHAASPVPDGLYGTPISYEFFVAQRSRIIQQTISQAVGDLRLMNPKMMHPVALVENHSSCQKNENGQSVLPNGQSWRSQLLLLCYSMKLIQEANSISKPFANNKPFGFQLQAPHLPYFLSSLLRSQAHPNFPDRFDSDMESDDFPDSYQEVEEDYDQLPPFKPLKIAQVKRFQNKQRREQVRLFNVMRKYGRNDLNRLDDDVDLEVRHPGSLVVSLPDMVLPPCFDGDNLGYRYRQLVPTMSQFLIRHVLDSNGWDYDCRYDGNHVVLMASTGAMNSRGDTAYGATLELRIKDKDFPISQNCSSLALSLMNWRGDLGLMANIQSQLSIGRTTRVLIHAGLNNKQRGQVTVKVSGPEQLQMALIGIVTLAISIYRSIFTIAKDNVH